ncbi:MAG: Dabb family protein [Actinobacteria bacterium]|nr:Dabb family protein [Actinomycetota bacterium]
MIWHVVRFDFAGVADDLRDDLERQLRGLEDLDCVGFLRVGRDLDQPTVTGLVTGFADAGELDRYRTHPDHLPVVEAIRAAGVATSRIDIESDDDPRVLA